MMMSDRPQGAGNHWSGVARSEAQMKAMKAMFQNHALLPGLIIGQNVRIVVDRVVPVVRSRARRDSSTSATVLSMRHGWRR
jgi:ABC-type nitrate/sulfonate/bicarbonate transport system ATPase subunit